MVSAPSAWTSYTIPGQKITGHGYETYRLKILLNNNSEILKLFIQPQGIAYSVWINSKLVAQNGIVGTDYATYKIAFIPNTYTFINDTSLLEVIVHLSNYNYTKGGLWGAITLGAEKQITQSSHREGTLKFILVGCLLIMSLYHLCLYLLRRNDFSSLFFSIHCLVVALRSFVIPEAGMFYNVFSESFPVLLRVRIEYITFFIAIPSFALYLYSLFKKEMSKIFVAVIGGISIVFTIITLVTPLNIFDRLIPIYQVVVIIAMIYSIYVVVLALVRKKDGALLILIGFIILIITVLNDILLAAGLIRTTSISDIGVTIFILFQSFILSILFSKAFFTVEKLSKQLLEFDKMKDEFLANTSHELRTPLNGINGLTESLIDQAVGSVNQKQQEILQMILTNSKRLSILVNDILDLSKLRNTELELQKEPIDISSAVNVVISLLQILYKAKNLEVKNLIEDSIPSVMADENRLIQILSNLIGNAIKFTEKGGIDIFAEVDSTNNMVKISVKDTGIGIAADKLEDIFNEFNQVDGSISR